jgi:hypothetical protein
VLGPGSLGAVPAAETTLTLRSPLATGLDSGLWCPYGDAADMPTDQRVDDGLSACFDSEPLDERLEILGFPELTLTLASDRPLALVAVRLCDVASGGESTLVTRGYLNLTHRESHEHPSPLEPGRRYEVAVRLNAIGYAFPPGHRIRLAVSSCYWPLLWPSPEPATLTLFAGPASALVLPVRSPSGTDGRLPPFEEPEGSEPLAVTEVTPGYVSRTVTRDVASGSVELAYAYGDGRRRLPDGLELEDSYRETFRVVGEDPLSARVETEMTVALDRGEWRARVETTSAMWSDAEAFHTTNAVEAFVGLESIFARTWTFRVPRDLV